MKGSGTITSKVTMPSRGGRMRLDAKAGYEATTNWNVRDLFVGYAILECRTRPVIPHQIRFQLDAAGLPLAVDPLYGGATELRLSSFKAGYRRSRRHDERPLIDRVSLHVQSLTFPHPRDGHIVRFEAAVPKDFRAAVHQLDRFGRMPK